MTTTVTTVKRPLVELPGDLHKALKIYAAQHETQVKTLVEAAVRDFLKRRGVTSPDDTEVR